MRGALGAIMPSESAWALPEADIKKHQGRCSTAVVQRFCKPKVGSSILSTGTIPRSKYFDGFSNESTYEVDSLQISFAVNLK